MLLLFPDQVLWAHHLDCGDIFDSPSPSLQQLPLPHFSRFLLWSDSLYNISVSIFYINLEILAFTFRMRVFTISITGSRTTPWSAAFWNINVSVFYINLEILAFTFATVSSRVAGRSRDLSRLAVVERDRCLGEHDRDNLSYLDVDDI